ncbi:MAG: transcription elongation factor GreA [Angelakisella sp.]
MSQEIIMTEDGYEKLIKELEELRTVKRSQIADKIKTARGFGDLSENSEYDEAKNEQAIMEGRILTIEEQLKHITIVSKDAIPKDIVSVGAIVKIIDGGEEFEYCLVSSVESSGDGDVPCITDKSPVGQALMGHKVGDTVTVNAPAGSFDIKISELRT